VISISCRESPPCCPREKLCEQNNRGEIKQALERLQQTPSRQEELHKTEKGGAEGDRQGQTIPCLPQSRFPSGPAATGRPLEQARMPTSTASAGEENFQ